MLPGVAADGRPAGAVPAVRLRSAALRGIDLGDQVARSPRPSAPATSARRRVCAPGLTHSAGQIRVWPAADRFARRPAASSFGSVRKPVWPSMHALGDRADVRSDDRLAGRHGFEDRHRIGFDLRGQARRRRAPPAARECRPAMPRKCTAVDELQFGCQLLQRGPLGTVADDQELGLGTGGRARGRRPAGTARDSFPDAGPPRCRPAGRSAGSPSSSRARACRSATGRNRSTSTPLGITWTLSAGKPSTSTRCLPCASATPINASVQRVKSRERFSRADRVGPAGRVQRAHHDRQAGTPRRQPSPKHLVAGADRDHGVDPLAAKQPRQPADDAASRTCGGSDRETRESRPSALRPAGPAP